MYFREYGTVQNCAIVSNVAPVGAGVHFYYGGLVQDCTISHNLAATTNYQPAGNFFYGGGVHCWCGGTVQNCTITDNAVSSSNCSPYYTYYCYGGGVHVEKEGLIQNCTIISNSVFGKNTAHGGGVYLHEGGTLQNSVVYGNSATAFGSTYATASGGGVDCDLGGTVQNCTITRNSVLGYYADIGGGVYCFRGGTLRNTICYFNYGENFYNDDPGPTYSYCCTTPSVAGAGNITGDPRLLDVAAGNCHLQSVSPCIDTGTTNGAPDLDLDCNTRPLDGNGDGVAAVDIGAYEFTTNRLSAPTVVSAGDGIFRNKVRVTWAAVSGAAAYEVWRHTVNNVFVATRIAQDVTTTSYNDTAVTLGQTYYYWVKAPTSGFSDSDTGYSGNRANNDFDGDGKTDLAVYNDTTGWWYMVYSSSGSLDYVKLGETGYTPVPGDFDGDGKTDVAVYNDTTGWWYMVYSSSGSLDYVKLGETGYTPIQ